jgi:hypothetical protein
VNDPNIEKPNVTDFELVLDHAWKWFEYHASQRMLMLRFYLTVIIAIGGGVGFLHHDRETTLEGILSVFGAVVSYSFVRLDRRVSDLIKLGEAALMKEQDRLSQSSGNTAIRISAAADALSGRFPYTYGQNFRLIFWIACACFIVVAIASFCPFARWLLQPH